MSSSVYFKFKSQKEPTRVEFDGTGISVFELKRDIIIKSGLGDGTDFDLAIYTEDGKEEYDDDTTIIPRSTTVVARRLPPMKPGAGRAARYVSGKMPVNAKNASRREQASKATAKGASNAIEQMHNAMTEEEKLSAMFNAQTEQWNAQQEEMSHQTPIFKPGTRRPANVPDHDPPNGYICYRCGEKGHWIQLCPTNDNPDFDNRPRVKRTTGIPRSFLKTVDKAAVLAQAAEDDTKAPTGIMVNADGDFVIAEPDKASWEKFQAKAKSGAAAQEVADLADKELQDRGLECPIDKKPFIDPMQTPCCKKTYCNDCITTALIESDFVCPGCQSEGVLIDNLQPDEEAEKKVEAFQKEKEARDKAKGEAGKDGKDGKDNAAGAVASTAASTDPSKANDATQASAGHRKPSPSATSTTTTTNGATTATKEADDAQKNGSPSDTSSTTISRKRPAELEAVNPKIPKAPKAMQQQQDAQAKAQNGDAMNGFGMNGDMSAMMGMGGMGMMPFGGMPMMGFGMGMNMPNMPNMPSMPSMNMGMPNMAMGNMGMGMGNMNMMMGMNGGGNGYTGGYNNNGGRYNGGYSNGYNNGYGGNGTYNQQGWGNRNSAYNSHNGGGYNRYNNNNNNNNNGYHQGQNGYSNQNGANHQNHQDAQSHQTGQTGQAGQNGQNGQGTGNNLQLTGNGNGTEDDAYFRKPVNPNRHFNKPKRVRPSDYREL